MTTVSIGIPAYNEEQNIGHLLAALLHQTHDSFVLKEIIVVSDGSTDGTEEQVKSVKDSRISLISRAKNEGIAFAQNIITDTATGDVLVLLDADVLPVGRHFLTEIIKPIQGNVQVGLVGADTISSEALGWFESIIEYSHELKQQIYKRIRGGDTVYLCHGRARALARPFYSQLKWPRVNAEDAYSYFASRRAGFRFVFAPSARIVFRSPRTFADYMKQSHRFHTSKEKLGHYFSRSFIQDSFRISLRASLPVLAWAIIRHPALTVSYLLIALYSYFCERLSGAKDQADYEISASSKAVVLS